MSDIWFQDTYLQSQCDKNTSQSSIFLFQKDYVKTMSEEELKNHIEALAVKRMDKPKKLSSECMKHWKEILSRQYNFDRGETSNFPLLSKITL